MTQVWKYRVYHDRPILMPEGAKVIAVGSSDSPPWPHIWAEVDTDAEFEQRNIRFFGTGQDLPPNREYFGTADCAGFIWHVYEVAP